MNQYLNNRDLNIIGLSIVGGISGRFLGGYIAWNIFNLQDNKKYTLRWYCGYTLLNISMIGGMIYAPIKYIKYSKE
jgi:hypothetical protein